MSNNIELLSKTENFTIGTNSNLSEILANVVKVGTDTSNVTISIPQDISSSYNLILPVRQGASGESLVYGADGQLKWHDTTVLKQVISVYGSTLTGNVVSTGIHDSPTYLDAYTANIVPMADNSKIFVQFKVNYFTALSASNQISFFIKKTYDDKETIFTESLFGPYNAAGGFTGQYISNLVDEALTSNSISYQLGYQINGNVYSADTLGILGYEISYNNTIVLQEFEGSGSNATSVWNKGADSNGLYYNDGTVHIGSTKNALGSQNTPGVALELSGNLVGTNAILTENVRASWFNGNLSGTNATLTENVRASWFNGNLSGTNATLTENVRASWFNGNLSGTNATLTENVRASWFNGNLSGTNATLTENVRASWFNGNLSGTNATLTENVRASWFNGNLNGNIYKNNLFIDTNYININNILRGNSNDLYGSNFYGYSFNGNKIETARLNVFDVLFATTDSSQVNILANKFVYNNANPNIMFTKILNATKEQMTITSNSLLVNNATTLKSNLYVEDNTIINKDLTVRGNLKVQGDKTEIISVEQYTYDNIITLNADGNVITEFGIEGNVSGTLHKFLYDTNNNYWHTDGKSIKANIIGDISGTNATLTENVRASWFNGNLSGTNATLTENVRASWFNGNLSGTNATLTENVRASWFNGNLSGTNATLTENVRASWFNGNLNGNIYKNNLFIDTNYININNILRGNSNDLYGSNFYGYSFNGNKIETARLNVFDVLFATTDSSQVNILANKFVYNNANPNIMFTKILNATKEQMTITSNSLLVNNATTLKSNLYVEDNTIINKDLTVRGNLKVQGDKTEIISVEYYTYDNIIRLNADGNVITEFGIEGNVSGTLHKFLYDTNNNYWHTDGKSIKANIIGDISGTNASFSGNIYAHAFIVEETYIGPNTLFINGTRVLNQNDNGSVNVYTDKIISDASNGLTIQANGNNGNIILDPSGTGTIQLNGDVELSGGNLNAETFIGDLSGNVNAVTMTATTTTTNNLSLNGILTTSNSTRVVGNLIPNANITYDLGSSTDMWRDVYVGPGSLYVNNKKVIEDNNGTINITTDVGQNLTIKTSGSGVLQLNSNVGGIDFNTSNGGTVNFNSDIVLQGNISMTNTGSTVPINLNDDVHVSGNLDVNDNLDVGGNLKVNRINREDNGYSALYLESVKVDGSSITGQLTGNVIGHVTGTVSSLSNLDTNNLSEGSMHKYYTVARVRGDVSGGLGINYNESTGVFSLPQEVSNTSNVHFNNVTVDGTLNSDDINTLQTSVASKQATITTTTDLTMQNLTLSGYLRGPTNMIIDPETHDDDTGTLIVKGNLQVLGTTTTINSETLTINDNSIILNNNYSGPSPSENASIEIERGDINNASIKWNEIIDQWEFYKEGDTLSNIKCNTIRVDNDNTLGNISASFSGSTLTISGDANISYGVCTATGNPGTLSALSVSYIEKNTQLLIYYTNNSGGDINIENVLTINDGSCKTNLSEQLTITNNSSALFCIVRVSTVYILTVSQLY